MEPYAARRMARALQGQPRVSGETIRVLLASPLPPPAGGIASWTARMLALQAPDDVRRFHVDISSHTLVHYTASVGLDRVWRHGRVAGRFLWSSARTRPDVVHLTTSYDAAFARDRLFVAWSRMIGAAVVLNIRGGDFERFFRSRDRAGQQRILNVLRQCSAVVPVTSETARFLSGLGLRDVRVIPNCIDVLESPTRMSLSHPRRWLYVGWLLPVKGLLEILQALQAFPDASLTLVGPFVDQNAQPSRDLFEETCRRLGVRDRVHVLPEMTSEQVRPLYREHDLFVFPTHREGFPNVLLEAMEAGLPIVASRVGGIPDMIEDGEEGLLVQAGNAIDLENAIRRLDHDRTLAARMGAAARKRVLERYAVNQVAEDWYRLYREVAEERKSA
jgi:glycosyltransferase involved in cell wall biosynthesis